MVDPAGRTLPSVTPPGTDSVIGESGDLPSVPTVYITAPPDAAPEIARTLVEERLAACVNRVACDSVYRWDGEVHADEEEVLLAKTTAEGYAALCERVVEVHPHDVPCIERFDEVEELDAFATWRAENVA